jgi:hypothetical protein
VSPIGERLTAASNRVYARIRHPREFEAGDEEGTAYALPTAPTGSA